MNILTAIDRITYKLFLNKPQEDIYKNLENSFKKKHNQWNFEHSKFQKKRFEKILEYCQQVPHSKILEIGCAEGHLTKYLLKLSKDVTAIDVSNKAIEAAKKIAPSAKYLCGAFETLNIKNKFDLIVCSETLYYIKEKDEVSKKIKRSGKYLVMSNHYVFPLFVEPYFLDAKLLKVSLVFNFKEGWNKFCTVTLRKISK